VQKREKKKSWGGIVDVAGSGVGVEIILKREAAFIVSRIEILKSGIGYKNSGEGKK
jgi:hypothetical protein